MNLLTGLLSDRLINALGWALLHSLWQGTLAALILALLLLVCRRFSSQSRYFIGVITLIFVLSLSVLSFVYTYQAEIKGRIVLAQDEANRNPAQAPKDYSKGTAEALFINAGLFRKVTLYFSRYAQRYFPLIVTLWLLGILVYFLRFMGGFAFNQRLKNRQSHSLSPDWQKKIQMILDRMKMTRPICFLESAKVKMPMVIGHFKPVILLPIGLLTGLPKEQAQAILMHELAHIVRRDYLVNLLQSFTDILYFFHPGVRWISSSIRAEREHCCDDLALSISGDSINFARALANVQSQETVRPASVVSFLGGKGKFFHRVERLMSQHKLSANFNERLTAACILFIAVLTALATAQASNSWTVSEIARNRPVMQETGSETQPLPERSRISFNQFEMIHDGRVEIIGDTNKPQGSKPEMYSWIINESTGKVVWILSNEMVKQHENDFTYQEIVHLKKGRYSWYFSREDLTILKVLDSATSSGNKEKIPVQHESEKGASVSIEDDPGSFSRNSFDSKFRYLDFERDWKGSQRRIRAVIDNGHVQGFALDNITFLQNDINKNWDSIVRILSEYENFAYVYKRPHKGVVNPRDINIEKE